MTTPVSRIRVFAQFNGVGDEFAEGPLLPSNLKGVSDSIGGAFAVASEEREYLIPTGKSLEVLDLYAACSDNAVGGAVELIERTTGGDAVITATPCAPSAKVPINQTYVGDGDRRIVLRRTQTPGTDAALVLGFWIGREEK